MTGLGTLIFSRNLFLWLFTHAVFLSVTGVATFIFALWWAVFWITHRGKSHFFFDPQDDFHALREGDRVLPKAAETATFEPMLKHYIGVTQLLVTIAAASIAFGGGNGNQASTASIWIGIAKLLLAWSVFYGVLFCALLLWRYDEYTQNVKSYTLPWHSTVFACGFSSLTFFTFGFVVWGFGLL
jgi:hypothetical protein